MIFSRLFSGRVRVHYLILPLVLVALLLLSAPAVQAESVEASSGYYHTVHYGETLSGIALYYGTTVQAIAQANNIVNPNWIYAGMVLYIPAGGGSPGTGYCRAYHTVTYGDTMIRIGAWYGASPWAIAQANNIYNMNLIYRGQVLCIPW